MRRVVQKGVPSNSILPSLSWIVTVVTELAPRLVPEEGLLNLTMKVSASSLSPSFKSGIVIVLLVSPTSKRRVPDTAV